MKQSKININEQNSSKEIENDFCRNLTFTDVDQALNALEINSKLLKNQKYDCCCLLRSNSSSSRLLLPLARRGRPYNSTRPNRLLCSNCTKIKHQQQIEIFENFNSNPILKTISFDLSPENENVLNNNQYQTNEMLIWELNSSNDNKIHLSYDTGSLNSNEKKILLDETIKKLQIILNKQTKTNDNQHTLQTTINILSSSHDQL